MDSDFSFQQGLPYDGADYVEQPSTRSYPSALDRPLDDYEPQPTREQRERPPPSTRLYLREEVKPMLNHRMASDLLEKRDDNEADEESTATAATLRLPIPSDDPDVRPNAVYLEGIPLTELPTDKIFSFVSCFSKALPLGIEWIADDRLVLVFSNSTNASSALSDILRTPESHPSSTETHSVPQRLWPDEYRPKRVRAQAAYGAKGSVRTDGEEEDERGMDVDVDVEVLEENKMKGAIQARWARSTDKKQRRPFGRSSFYDKHGSLAGKPPGYKDRSRNDYDGPAATYEDSRLSPSTERRRRDGPQTDLLDEGFSMDRSTARRRQRQRSASPGVGGDDRPTRSSLSRRLRSRTPEDAFSSRLGAAPANNDEEEEEALEDQTEEIEVQRAGGGMRSDFLTAQPMRAPPPRRRGEDGGRSGRDGGGHRWERARDLDAELDAMRDGDWDGDRSHGSSWGDKGQGRREERGGGGGGGRRERREPKKVEDLDAELEAFLQERRS